MSACCTTQTRPAPPCAMPNADAVIPAPRSSPSPQHRAALSASPTATGYAAATLEAAELLQRGGRGDPAAWEEILCRYRGVVIAKIRTFRLQDADALDAAQMTWLRLAENIHRIQHPGASVAG